MGEPLPLRSQLDSDLLLCDQSSTYSHRSDVGREDVSGGRIPNLV